jgi:mRNA interferase YafQ
MRAIETTNSFDRDLRREHRTDRKVGEVLAPIVDQLAADEPLPRNKQDHALTGNWKGFRECHLKPDLLLIYRKAPETLQLVRMGSHSELFGK